MIGIEKPGVKSAQEPVDEKQEKDLANTENISGWPSRARVAHVSGHSAAEVPGCL